LKNCGGGIEFLFEITALVFLTINLGMGAAVLVLTIALAMLFRQLDRQIST
jgi:hypothetical protein